MEQSSPEEPVQMHVIDEDEPFSPQELKILACLDSTQIDNVSNFDETTINLLEKAVSYIEALLISAEAERERTNAESSMIEPETMIKLGHYQLLLLRFPEALSAYEVFMSTSDLKTCESNPVLSYGIGIAYAGCGQVICGADWMLGLRYKFPYFHTWWVNIRIVCYTLMCGSLRQAFQHLQISEGILERRGLQDAIEQFSDLKALDLSVIGKFLRAVNVGPRTLQSIISYKRYLPLLRVGPETRAKLLTEHAADLLTTVYNPEIPEIEPYPNAVLYQQQNQAMDALQAYICAVQLDKDHREAWFNLGVLFENDKRYLDAYKCYVNSANSESGDAIRDDDISPQHQQRIEVLREALERCPQLGLTDGHQHALCSIEEAWNIPISAEQYARTYAAQLQRGERPEHVQPAAQMNQSQLRPHLQAQLQAQLHAAVEHTSQIASMVFGYKLDVNASGWSAMPKGQTSQRSVEELIMQCEENKSTHDASGDTSEGVFSSPEYDNAFKSFPNA